MWFDVPSVQENAPPGWPARATSPITQPPDPLAHERAPVLAQAKLIVGAAGDRYEQEADRVAEQVVRGGVAAHFGHSFSRIPIDPPVQRACVACEENDTIRAKPAGPPLAAPSLFAGTVPPRSSGAPLPASTRAFFEPHYRQDFSSVRVHNNTAAHLFTRDLGAEAATVGRDIFFAPGRFAPETRAGQRLLAHELTHVVQQVGGHEVIQRQVASGQGQSPRSAYQSLNPSTLSDTDLAHEINAIRRSLREGQSSSAEREQMAAALGRLGAKSCTDFLESQRRTAKDQVRVRESH